MSLQGLSYFNKSIMKYKLHILFFICLLYICATYHLINTASSPTNYSLKLTIVDNSGKPIAGAEVFTWYKEVSGSWTYMYKHDTDEAGKTEFIFQEGTILLNVKWKSPYNPDLVFIAVEEVSLHGDMNKIIYATVYDIELRLITSGGLPIINAEVSVSGVSVGLTDQNGKVQIKRICDEYQSIWTGEEWIVDFLYTVTATWFGTDISPKDKLRINASTLYTFKASNAMPLSVKVVDNIDKPIIGAWVEIYHEDTMIILYGQTDNEGLVKTGVSNDIKGEYDITILWKSSFNPEPVQIKKTSIRIDRTFNLTISTTVYNIELQFVSSTREPIANAEVRLAGVLLGVTDADGKVLAKQVPIAYSKKVLSYPVMANWFGVDISPDPISLTGIKSLYVLTVRNVVTLTIQVVGAQGQALKVPQVEIMNSAGTTVFSGFGNELGVVNVVVPYDTYSIHTDYKGFTSDQSISISSATPTTVKMSNSVFIEFEPFGPMTFVTFLLWIIAIVIVIVIIAVLIYGIQRRQRLKQTIKTITNFHTILKPICPKCGYNLERRGDVFWCPNCVGWIAPKDAKWV